MGVFHYAHMEEPIYVDDRTLAHLKVVIAAKLRRKESFTLSWTQSESSPGRSTIWMHPSIPLRFDFDTPDVPELNPSWIQALMRSANSADGIILDDEILDRA